jgi:LEA14-like dessication related protein
MARLALSPLAAALWLLLTGCASLDLEPPELTLVDLQPSEATLFETTLSVRLRLANPNPEPLTLNGASFKLTLGGHKVGRGLCDETVTVGRFGTEIIAATFHVSNASLLLRLQKILDRQSVAYGISGKLYLDHSGSSRKLRLESSGQLDLGGTSPGPATVP